MSRMVSFVVLVAVTLVLAWLFLTVMADFLLPMFLAVILAVVFRPMHLWILDRCRGRERLAAALTTLAIVLVVLLPAASVLTGAAAEGVATVRNFDQQRLDDIVRRLGQTLDDVRQSAAKLGFAIPPDKELVQMAVKNLEQHITPAATGTIQFLIRRLVDLAIMLVSLYFFLADGPGMIRTAMRLSPLDDRYERELVEKFATVSRAVVLATLLSALAQGVLAGIGYLLVGTGSMLLLTVMSALFAIVPLVGASAVWIPCCLWLYLLEGRLGAAIFLAAWGLVVVSMVDNLVKPWVLKGQSNLHPLLALLSVLGGATALGPIGILIGPMVVAFLQALLNILQYELAALDRKPAKT